MAAEEPQTTRSGTLSPTAQSVISVVLFIHLFCVVVVLTSNATRSPLQARLVEVLRPYTQPLYLELDFEPFYLTRNGTLDYDHRLEVLKVGGQVENPEDWTYLAEGRAAGGESRKRFHRLGRTIAFYAQQNENAPIGILVASIANQQIKQGQETPEQIRCRRHFALTQDQVRNGTREQSDPWGPATFVEVYRAIPIIQGEQVVGVTKVDPEGQVARPVENKNRRE